MKQQDDIFPSMENAVIGKIFIREANFSLSMGEEGKENIIFRFCVKRTLLNRLKYWLFCKFFPFRITRWDELEEMKNG